MDSDGLPWNGSYVTSTGNVVMDMLFNFQLECGARLHKLRVYETMTEETGREVCAYLLVRGSVHAHAYALALKKLTGQAIEKVLPVPNINLERIPECRKYLAEGRHRYLYTNSPTDYRAMAGIWGNGETALPGDPPGDSWSSTACLTAAGFPSSTAWPRPSPRTTRPRRCSRSRRSSTPPRADSAPAGGGAAGAHLGAGDPGALRSKCQRSATCTAAGTPLRMPSA